MDNFILTEITVNNESEGIAMRNVQCEKDNFSLWDEGGMTNNHEERGGSVTNLLNGLLKNMVCE